MKVFTESVRRSDINVRTDRPGQRWLQSERQWDLPPPSLLNISFPSPVPAHSAARGAHHGNQEAERQVRLRSSIIIITENPNYFTFRLRILESENMRLSATINSTNRQVDIRLNEIEQRLEEDSSQEDFSIEEEEKNQESFI